MKAELTERMETVDQMFSRMVLDTFIKMKQADTGKSKFIISRSPITLKQKAFFNTDVSWIFYSGLDDRIKYAIDILHTNLNFIFITL